MTEYLNKMILTHEQGHPRSTVEYPWPDGTVEAYEALNVDFIITEKADISSIYVENDAALARPDPCWSAPQEPVALGSSFIISGLPVGAKVTIGPESYIVEDGTFEFESAIADSFPYSVEAWPYYPSSGVMVFA